MRKKEEKKGLNLKDVLGAKSYTPKCLKWYQRVKVVLISNIIMILAYPFIVFYVIWKAWTLKNGNKHRRNKNTSKS
jgi:hypothetical protein